MKSLLLASVTLLLIQARIAESGVRTWPKVLLLGDSITERAVGPVTAPWSAMLSQRFHREADIVNRGAGGYTTRGYKLIIGEAVQELDPQSVAAAVISLGANDSELSPSAAHVSLKDYESNLKDLVKYLETFGVPKDRVILLPPTPFYQGSESLNDHSPAVTEQYARAASQVALTSGITTIDVHTIFKNDPRGGDLFADGLHLNFDGAKLFYESILPAVEDKLKRYEGRTELVHHFGPPS